MELVLKALATSVQNTAGRTSKIDKQLVHSLAVADDKTGAIVGWAYVVPRPPDGQQKVEDWYKGIECCSLVGEG